VPAPELDEGLRLRRRLVERNTLAEGRDLVVALWMTSTGHRTLRTCSIVLYSKRASHRTGRKG